MPSTTFEPARPAQRAAATETVLLFVLITGQAPLLLHGLGLGRTGLSSLLATLAFAAAAAAAVHGSRRAGARTLPMVVHMLVWGNLGLLAGAWLDFGAAGLAGLTHWCHMHPGLAPSDVAAKLAGAPWSYGLMLAGCNLGMAVADRCGRGCGARSAPAHRARALRCYAACNLGMLAGMLLAEGLMPGGHHVHHMDSAAIVLMLAVMALGMTAGMLLGWWATTTGPGGCIPVSVNRRAASEMTPPRAGEHSAAQGHG